MKMNAYHVRLGMYVGIVLMMCAIAGAVITVIFGVRRYSYACDSSISQTTHNAFTQQLRSLHHGWVHELPVLANSFKKQHLWIDTISLQRTSFNTIHATIAPDVPLARIRNKVITKHHRIIDDSVFAADLLEKIPTLHITFNMFADHILLPFLDQVESWVTPHLLNYQIYWKDEYEVYLTEAQNTRFVILCNAQQIPTQALLDACASLKAMLDERGSFRGRTTTHWVADVRFEHQIVLYCQKGGSFYG